MTVAVMPDLGAVLVAWISADALVETYAPGRVGPVLPVAEGRSYVAVTVMGGSTIMRGWARSRRLQVDCWAGSSERTGRADVAALAEAVRVAVEQLTDQVFGGIVFGAVDITGDLFYLPDTTFLPWRPRYVFTAAAVCHPLPT